jgi:hypothetical protein
MGFHLRFVWTLTLLACDVLTVALN